MECWPVGCALVLLVGKPSHLSLLLVKGSKCEMVHIGSLLVKSSKCEMVHWFKSDQTAEGRGLVAAFIEVNQAKLPSQQPDLNCRVRYRLKWQYLQNGIWVWMTRAVQIDDSGGSEAICNRYVDAFESSSKHKVGSTRQWHVERNQRKDIIDWTVSGLSAVQVDRQSVCAVCR